MAERSILDKLISDAKAVASPHVDLAGLLGTDKPVLVSLDDLHQSLLHPGTASVSVHWDDDKTVTLKHENGTVMGTFTLKF